MSSECHRAIGRLERKREPPSRAWRRIAPRVVLPDFDIAVSERPRDDEAPAGIAPRAATPKARTACDHEPRARETGTKAAQTRTRVIET